MGDELKDKSRKELKELCSQNNIRTAGVKHEDLVRLLRNKLYPPAPSTPRLNRSTSLKPRGAKEPSPVKDNATGAFKTPVKTGGKARDLRSSTLPRESEVVKEVASFQRKNSGLSRKPLLTKSSTFSSRSRGDGRVKGGGEGHENANLQRGSVRRAGKVTGLSPLSRRSAESPGQLEESALREVEEGAMAEAEDNARGEDVASAFERSDAGSERPSEVATDAGPDTMSDFSDADEFRSVSSEPISRFGSLGKRSSLRTESSKMSLLSAQSGLSFFTAGSWSSENSRSLDNLLASDARREEVFPEFPDGSDFLVGDADALESSFLAGGAADPDVVVSGNEQGLVYDAMHSPMARDYVNYSRGSEDYGGSDQLRDMDSADGDAANAKDSGRTNDEALAPGTVAIESERSSGGAKEFDHQLKSAENPSEGASEMGHSDSDGYGADTPTQPESCSLKDETSSVRYSEGHSSLKEDSEAHSRLSGVEASSESGSPAFDSRDYSVAKKLEFEPVEITHSPPAKRVDESNFQKPEERSAKHPPETANSSDSNPTSTSHDNTVAELDQANHSEQEGDNCKSRDKQCCEAAHDYNKPLQDGHEKDDAQAKLSFPLSFLLWCSQSCSSTSGTRSQALTS